MKEGLCTMVGIIGSFISSLFGGFDAALATLILFTGRYVGRRLGICRLVFVRRRTGRRTIWQR